MADRNRYRSGYSRTDVCKVLGFGPEPLLIADSDPDDEQERYSRGRADQVHGGSVGFRALIGPSKGIQKDTGSDGPQEVLWEDGSADELTLVLHKLKYYVEKLTPNDVANSIYPMPWLILCVPTIWATMLD